MKELVDHHGPHRFDRYVNKVKFNSMRGRKGKAFTKERILRPMYWSV